MQPDMQNLSSVRMWLDVKINTVHVRTPPDIQTLSVSEYSQIYKAHVTMWPDIQALSVSECG